MSFLSTTNPTSDSDPLSSGESDMSEQESSDSYKPGGYHPVTLGDTFKNGRYIVISKMGWGQFSTVWLAWDRLVKLFVALKISRSSQRYIDAAIDEIILLEHIRKNCSDDAHHNNVIQMLEYFTHRGPHGIHVVIVMESLGSSLLSLIRYHKNTGVPLKLVKELTRQMLNATSYLHDTCGIIHCDIKPENILLYTKKSDTVSYYSHTHDFLYDSIPDIYPECDWETFTAQIHIFRAHIKTKLGFLDFENENEYLSSDYTTSSSDWETDSDVSAGSAESEGDTTTSLSHLNPQVKITSHIATTSASGDETEDEEDGLSINIISHTGHGRQHPKEPKLSISTFSSKFSISQIQSSSNSKIKLSSVPKSKTKTKTVSKSAKQQNPVKSKSRHKSRSRGRSPKKSCNQAQQHQKTPADWEFVVPESFWSHLVDENNIPIPKPNLSAFKIRSLALVQYPIDLIGDSNENESDEPFRFHPSAFEIFRQSSSSPFHDSTNTINNECSLPLMDSSDSVLPSQTLRNEAETEKNELADPKDSESLSEPKSKKKYRRVSKWKLTPKQKHMKREAKIKARRIRRHFSQCYRRLIYERSMWAQENLDIIKIKQRMKEHPNPFLSPEVSSRQLEFFPLPPPPKPFSIQYRPKRLKRSKTGEIKPVTQHLRTDYFQSHSKHPSRLTSRSTTPDNTNIISDFASGYTTPAIPNRTIQYSFNRADPAITARAKTIAPILTFVDFEDESFISSLVENEATGHENGSLSEFEQDTTTNANGTLQSKSKLGVSTNNNGKKLSSTNITRLQHSKNLKTAHFKKYQYSTLPFNSSQAKSMINLGSSDPPGFQLKSLLLYGVPKLPENDIFRINAILRPSDLHCKIVDFGNSCWINHHFSSNIQTRQYRSPEIILGSHYNERVDMWSIACTVFEIATTRYLFDPVAGSSWSCDEDHLAQCIELLGNIPNYLIRSGYSSRQYFDRLGRLRNIDNLSFMGLYDILHQKYRFSRHDSLEFSSFLSSLLEFDSSNRASAGTSLQHPWLRIPHPKPVSFPVEIPKISDHSPIPYAKSYLSAVTGTDSSEKGVSSSPTDGSNVDTSTESGAGAGVGVSSSDLSTNIESTFHTAFPTSTTSSISPSRSSIGSQPDLSALQSLQSDSPIQVLTFTSTINPSTLETEQNCSSTSASSDNKSDSKSDNKSDVQNSTPNNGDKSQSPTNSNSNSQKEPENNDPTSKSSPLTSSDSDDGFVAIDDYDTEEEEDEGDSDDDTDSSISGSEEVSIGNHITINYPMPKNSSYTSFRELEDDPDEYDYEYDYEHTHVEDEMLPPSATVPFGEQVLAVIDQNNVHSSPTVSSPSSPYSTPRDSRDLDSRPGNYSADSLFDSHSHSHSSTFHKYGSDVMASLQDKV